MIRINLLGTAKPKKGKRGRRVFAMPQITTEGPSPLIAGLALLVLTSAGIYVYHMQLERAHDQLQTQINEANRQIASMAKVKQAYLERQKDYDVLKRRFDVIDQLRASQTGPQMLLVSVSQTVSSTEGVWLLSMHDDGATVGLDGIALGPTAVAKLMTNLRNSGYFKNVELHDTAQDDNPKVQTFTFSMVCEKAKA
jgi:type IV pilus assembly protein PilN